LEAIHDVRYDQHRWYGSVLCVRCLSLLLHSCCLHSYRLIPETKGKSLEEMDIIFGAVDAAKRKADIEEQTRRTFPPYSLYTYMLNILQVSITRIMTLELRRGVRSMMEGRRRRSEWGL
jgi:hypothetical protein